MNLEKLVEIKISIEEELKLYEELSVLFEEKRKVLIANKVDSLLAVDDKILNVVDALKASVNHRFMLSNNKNIGISKFITYAQNVNIELADEMKNLQVKINTLIEKIAQQERVIKELLRHGLILVTKTLNLISNATPAAGDYNNLGKNIHNEIGKISSVVEEV